MNIYSLKKVNNGVIKLWKRVDIVGFKRHYGLDNKVSRIVGFTPDYKGFRPSKPVLSHNYFTEFYRDRFKHINKTFPDLVEPLQKSILSERIVFSGGYDSSTNHLSAILTPNPSKYDEKQILDVLEKGAFKWFNSPIVEFDDPEEMIYTTNFNKKSSPGHYTGKLIGKNKGTTNLYSVNTAIEIFKDIKQKPHKNWYLWELLGREKDIKIEHSLKDYSSYGIYNNLPDASTRVVLSADKPAAHLLCWFAQKLSSCLMRYNNKFDIKEKFSYKKYEKYYYNRERYDFWVDADWSNFDANVDTPFIKIAGAILLGSFSFTTKENLRISYFIIESIITKYILIPPGIVVECTKGVPSGHPFTTLINCYINIIYWSIIGYEIYGDNYVDNMELTVYGDDALVWFKSHPRIWEIDKICENNNIKSDPIVPKLTFTRTYENEQNSPDFLKRVFDPVRVFWNHKKRFDRILYQTSKRDINDQILLIISFIETAPFDKQFNLLSMEFFGFCRHKYSHLINYDVMNQMNNIQESINKIELTYLPEPKNNMSGYNLEKGLLTRGEKYLEKIDKPIRVIRKDHLLMSYALSKSISYLNKNKDFLIKAYEYGLKLPFATFHNEFNIEVPLDKINRLLRKWAVPP